MRRALIIAGTLLFTGIAIFFAMFHAPAEVLGGEDPAAVAKDGQTQNEVTDGPAVAEASGKRASTGRDGAPPAESKPSSAPVIADLSNAASILRGSAIDSSRMPVAGAEVSVIRVYGQDSRKNVSKGTTNSEGKFEIGINDRDGWGWRIEVRAAGYATSYLTDVPVWLNESEVGAIMMFPATTLRGTVVNRDGAPLAGAKIYVRTVREAQVDENDDSDEEKVIKPSTTTGPDGSFTVANLPAGRVSVGAELLGYADAMSPGVLLGEKRPNKVELTLGTEDLLNGTVVEDTGSAIPKAKILTYFDENRGAFWRKSIESDANGAFTIRGLERNKKGLGISVWKTGYSSVWSDGASLPADEKYVLKKVTMVTVKVDAPDGAPPVKIQSARFELRPRQGRWSNYGNVQKTQYQKVAPNIWRISTELTGSVRVAVNGADGSEGASPEFEISPKSAQDLETTIKIERGGSLVGKIVKSDTTPVGELRVEAVSQKTGRFSKVVTAGADGLFTFENMAPGPTTLMIRSKDWVADPVIADVRSGEKTENIEIVVKKPSRLVGRVTVAGGPPSEPIVLLFYKIQYHENWAAWNRIGTVSTASDGTYSIAPMPSGRIAIVPKRFLDPDDGGIRGFESEIPHPEYNEEEQKNWRWIAEVPPEGEAVADVDLETPKYGYIKGVVTVNGEPRSGLNLWIYNTRGGGGDWRSDSTDAEGKFKFKLDRAGDYQVQLNGDGLNASKMVSIGPGEEREIEFTLSTGSVEGSVADLSGQGLSVLVALERERKKGNGENDYYYYWDSPQQNTKADGSYHFSDIPAGSYRVIVRDQKKRFAVVTSAWFTIGAREKYPVPQIRVPLEAPLIVQARTPEGKPARGSVQVLAAPGSEPLGLRTINVWIGNTGAMKIHGIRPGAVIIKFFNNGQGKPQPNQTVTLPSDGSATVVTFEVKKPENPTDGKPAEAGANPLSNLGYAQSSNSDSNPQTDDSNEGEATEYDFGWNPYANVDVDEVPLQKDK